MMGSVIALRQLIDRRCRTISQSANVVTEKSASSQIEGQFVEVNIWGNIADLTTVDGDLVGEHAWCWNLNGIRPIVVVVAQSIGEVQNGILGYQRSILSNIEVSWLHSTLSDGMGNEEEIKLAVDNFWLLNEAVINIGSLRWIEDLSLSIAGTAGLLKESLAHTLVNNDESYFWKRKAFSLRVVLIC